MTIRRTIAGNRLWHASVDRHTALYLTTRQGTRYAHLSPHFANSHEELSPDAAELALAIDGYKLRHRRRFITYEEMLDVVKSLGYTR